MLLIVGFMELRWFVFGEFVVSMGVVFVRL